MTQKTGSPILITRPISPHLSIYRPQMTTVLSITHRATGIALSAGMLLLVVWLWAAAYSPDAYGDVASFCTGILGRIMLFGWAFSFYFHLCNGVRHLFWDIGKGFEIHHAYRSGYAVLIVTALLTLATWAAVISDGGAS